MSDDRIIDLYDQTIQGAGEEGMKVAEGRDKVVAAVTADPDAFDLPPTSELHRAYVEKVINGERSSRKGRRLAYFQTCHDALNDMTIMGRDDPILDLAMRTGERDGVDKALRFFGVEDWLEVLGASADNVRAAIIADRDLRAIVNPIIAAYSARRARLYEDLLPEADA
jgi:hypothetical protein